MKKVDLPLNRLKQYPGKWVVIDPRKNHIIAVGEKLSDVSPLVMSTKEEKVPPGEKPYTFLVPRKGEGPYVLWVI